MWNVCVGAWVCVCVHAWPDTITQCNSTIYFSLQFSRVLKDLELDSLVNALELRLLYRKFDVKVGGWSNVHYIDFCAVCENYPH